VKWRNQALALFCLLAFAGLGVLYFQHWVIRKPFGIVLFIGEGLAPGRLATTRTYAGGAATRLSLDSMPHVALLKNYSKDFGSGSGCRCNCNCDRRESNQSRYRDQRRGEVYHDHH